MEIEDKDIVETIRSNLEKGFRLLMQKYEEPIYWYIRRLTVSHEDAQDAMQETFLRIFRSFSQFREINSFKAWIYRIATNETLRLLAVRKKKQDDGETTEAGQAQAETYINYDGIEAKFQKAILSLPEKQQITFQLRYYDELNYEEIANVTGATATSAKANYHVAKNKIIRYMNSID